MTPLPSAKPLRHLPIHDTSPDPAGHTSGRSKRQSGRPSVRWSPVLSASMGAAVTVAGAAFTDGATDTPNTPAANANDPMNASDDSRAATVTTLQPMPIRPRSVGRLPS